MYGKNYEPGIMQVTKGALISSRKCTKVFGSRARWGSLQCSPYPLAGFKGLQICIYVCMYVRCRTREGPARGGVKTRGRETREEGGQGREG